MNQLKSLIRGCRKGKRESQKELYAQFYNYAMSIALRYSRNREEAQEIVNDGFMKVFTRLDKYNDSLSFQGWLRRIIVNSAIDFYRRNEKHHNHLDIVHASDVSSSADSISQLTEKEIMEAVQKLSPAYKMVFNLYVVEGYKHDEIAQKLGISPGTSKSNLAKARLKLQKMLEEIHMNNNNKKHG